MKKERKRMMEHKSTSQIMGAIICCRSCSLIVSCDIYIPNNKPIPSDLLFREHYLGDEILGLGVSLETLGPTWWYTNSVVATNSVVTFIIMLAEIGTAFCSAAIITILTNCYK